MKTDRLGRGQSDPRPSSTVAYYIEPMGYAVVCHPPGSYRGRSYFRDAKKRTKAEEAARRWKSSVAHCRGSQRPQRRTCESAVMGIMQNYGRAARETRGYT